MSRWMRQAHRWLSVLFAAFVLANFAAMPLADDDLGLVIGGLTILPLTLLLVSGLYLFALPYVRGRGGPSDG